MIVSAKPNRSNRRWSQVCVLVGALVVLPLGLASAQDYEAVGKRLKESVMKGEITERQADAMMDALKKETRKIGTKDAAKNQGSADLEVIWEKLQAQVRAGELTKEQARDKMTALKAEAAGKDSQDKKVIKKDAIKKDRDADKTTAYLMKLKEDLAAEVEAGKISKEDAFKKYETAKRDILEKEAGKKDLKDKPVAKKDEDKATAYLMKLKEDLGAAVEAGKISKEDAIRKYAAAVKDIKEKTVAKKDQESDKAAAGPTKVKVKKDLDAAVKTDKVGKKDPVKKRDAAVKDSEEKPAVKKDRDMDRATAGPVKVRKDRDSDVTPVGPAKVKKDPGAAVEGGKIRKKDAPEAGDDN